MSLVTSLVRSLLNALSDKSEEARHAVGVSLLSIAGHNLQLVLSEAISTIKNGKVDHGHRVAILKLMGRAIDECKGVTESLSSLVLPFAISEMTSSRDVISDQQGSASHILVACSLKGGHEAVMAEVGKHLKAGDVPFYFVMKTLGDLGLASPALFVPRVKEIMTKLLPTFGQIKHSHIRYIYARCIGSMAEAVMMYYSLPDDARAAAGPKIAIEDFHSEFFTAFDMMFTKWMGEKEAEVRHATAHALAHIGAVISRGKFEESVPQLVPGVLGLYKKCQKIEELLVLTKGLTRLLEVCTLNGSRVLETQLPMLLGSIHPYLCKPVDYQVAASSQLHAEMLRCFEVLTRVFSDNILGFLTERLASKDASVRIGTIDILKHLVTRNGAEMTRLGDLVVSGVKQLIPELDPKVALSLSQLLAVMGAEGYLVHEGSQALISFLVSNAAPRPADLQAAGGGGGGGSGGPAAGAVGPDGKPLALNPTVVTQARGEARDVASLRTACERVVDRLADGVPCMENVLWPFLFEFLMPREHTEALPIVLRNVALLGNRKREKGDSSFFIDFAKNVNVAKPHALVGRLLVMLNAPGKKELASEIIKALIAIGPILSEPLSKMWEQALPRLLNFLNTRAGTPEWDENVWGELTLRLFRETLECVSDEEWLIHLSEDLSSQYDLYMRETELKRALTLYMGLVLQRVTKRALIRGKVDRMFDVVDHTSNVDRMAFAQGFGYAAGSHMDTALEKLQHALKNDCVRKSTGFFSKDKSEKDIDNIKSTVMLAYGAVASNAPPNMITTRLEVHILNNNFTPELLDCKTIVRKTAVIRAVEWMAKASHPAALGVDFILKPRDELALRLVGLVGGVTGPIAGLTKDQMEKHAQALAQGAAEINMEIRILWARAMSALVLLPPALPTDTEARILETGLKFLAIPPALAGGGAASAGAAGAPAPAAGTSKDSPSSPAVGKTAPAASTPTSASTQQSSSSSSTTTTTSSSSSSLTERDRGEMEVLLGALGNLLATVLAQNPTLETLGRILKALEPWLFSGKSALHRRRAVDLVSGLLKKVIDMIGEGALSCAEGRWKGIGTQAALMVPRLADTDSAVRRSAMGCLELMLYIDFLLSKSKRELPEQLTSLKELGGQIVDEDVTQQVTVIWNFSLALSELVNAVELPSLLETLLSRAQDSDTETVSSSVVVLNGILQHRGAEMAHAVSGLVQGLVKALAASKDDKNINGILRSFRTLASHHLKPVVEELLSLPVPHPQHVVKCVQVLAKAKPLAGPLVEQLLETMNFAKFIERTDKGEQPAHAPVAATCTLGEVLEVKEVLELVGEKHAVISCTVLLRFGTSVGVNKGEATKHCVATLKKLLDLTDDQATKALLDQDGRWERLASETAFSDVVSDIVAPLCEGRRAQLPAMFDFSSQFITGSNERQKVGAVTIIAQLLGCCGAEDSDFVRQLLNVLLARQTDKASAVKVHAMRGLGNLTAAGAGEVNRYSNHVLMALLHGVEDADETVALTSMNSLARIFDVIDQANVTPMMVNLTLRVRPSFEKPNPGLRLAALSLFATLCKFSHCEEARKENFAEQVHANLVCVVLHGRDDDRKVREACMRALVEIGKLFRVPDLERLLADQAQDSKEYYDDFLDSLSQLLVSHFASNVNMYIQNCLEAFKSQWVPLKANAAILACSLMAKARTQPLARVDADVLGKELISLLRDQHPVVRTKVAKAMSLLYEY